MPSFIVTITPNETIVEALGQLPGDDMLRRALNEAEIRYVPELVNAQEDRQDVVHLLDGRVLGWMPIESAPTDLGLRLIGACFSATGAIVGLPFITYHLSHDDMWHDCPTHWHPRPVPADFVKWRLSPSHDLAILLKHPEVLRIIEELTKEPDEGE